MSGNPSNPSTPSNPVAPDNEPTLNPEDFIYYSPRDLDGDGRDDIVHAKDHDGVSQLFHLDEAGDVALRELDSDGDGTYDTQQRIIDEATTQFAQDTTGDGSFDTVSYVDDETGAALQQDHYAADGTRTESRLDTDGDGKTDIILRDTSGDGEFDEVILDTDKDGWVNTRLVDTDGDGEIDELHYDADNQDGVLETVFTLDDLPGGLGSVSDFTEYETFDPTLEDAGMDNGMPDAFDGGF